MDLEREYAEQPKLVADLVANYQYESKITSIKRIRSMTGWGLKESKDFVEYVLERIYIEERSKKFNDITKAKHYNIHPSGVECITIIRHHNYNVGAVIKYLWRAGLKDSEPVLKDMKKALYYLTDEIVRVEEEQKRLKEEQEKNAIPY